MPAIAGFVILVRYGGVGFYDGFLLGFKALTAAIIGGIGSVPGAMLGGLAAGQLGNPVGRLSVHRVQGRGGVRPARGSLDLAPGRPARPDRGPAAAPGLTRGADAGARVV